MRWFAGWLQALADDLCCLPRATPVTHGYTLALSEAQNTKQVMCVIRVQCEVGE